MFIEDTELWAEKLFSGADLGDARRSRRLVSIAGALASHTGQSLAQSSKSSADIEAAYRFTRNQNIEAQSIAEAGYAMTAEYASNYDCLLAIEDTTSLSFTHKTVREELGYTTSNKDSKGIYAHSVLLFAPEEKHIVGLIEQNRWTRDVGEYSKKHKRHKRLYEEKESYKWERASSIVAERLGTDMEKVISVCDREADIIEYLTYKTAHQQRFIVRSFHNRNLNNEDERLYQFSESLKLGGTRTVEVTQKGGRNHRIAECEVFYAPVSIKAPEKKEGNSISLNYVCCRENNNDSGLKWHILTSEPVGNQDDAQKILDYYEKRWLIEDFHKAWKSGGTCVESLRMQSKDNLEKIIIILSFIAVRLQQLRYLGLNKTEAEKQSCEKILSPVAWKLLWLKTEKGNIPNQAPSVYWAYINLGRLAGWYDSKRTGRVGWERLWQGWFLLQTILEGYLLTKSLNL